jgi:hypothetical protein
MSAHKTAPVNLHTVEPFTMPSQPEHEVALLITPIASYGSLAFNYR